jgi:hypothetical protein
MAVLAHLPRDTAEYDEHGAAIEFEACGANDTLFGI